MRPFPWSGMQPNKSEVAGRVTTRWFCCSLTLNKLQQKRMLEEKLAQKRRRQMEKLLKKQSLEVKVCVKQF